MVVSKNQIRPRRKKFHFTNAEILTLDSAFIVPLVLPVALGQVVMLERVQVRASISVIYTNISAAVSRPVMVFFDDFNIADEIFIEDDLVAVTAFSSLFAQTGMNLLEAIAPSQVIDVNGVTVVSGAINWLNEADAFANGGITMIFMNGASGDLTGGDPANFLDIFIDYKIINLDINQ